MIPIPGRDGTQGGSAAVGGRFGEQAADVGEVVDALPETVPPDVVGGDVRGEGVAGETKEGFGVREGHAEGGGHGEDGVLGRVAVEVGDEPGIGRSADARRRVEGHGIAGMDFADALLEAFGEGAGVAGRQTGEQTVGAGFLAKRQGRFAGDLKTGAGVRGFLANGPVPARGGVRPVWGGRLAGAEGRMGVGIVPAGLRIAGGRSDRENIVRGGRGGGIRICGEVIDGGDAGIVEEGRSGFAGDGLAQGGRNGGSGFGVRAEEALEGVLEGFHDGASFLQAPGDCKRKRRGASAVFPG